MYTCVCEEISSEEHPRKNIRSKISSEKCHWVTPASAHAQAFIIQDGSRDSFQAGCEHAVDQTELCSSEKGPARSREGLVRLVHRTLEFLLCPEGRVAPKPIQPCPEQFALRSNSVQNASKK
jgi:hypothetical protein